LNARRRGNFNKKVQTPRIAAEPRLARIAARDLGVKHLIFSVITTSCARFAPLLPVIGADV